MKLAWVNNPFLLLIGFFGDSLPDIVKEIAKEDEEKHKRHVRRVIAKQERLKSGPPRFGRHKYLCLNST